MPTKKETNPPSAVKKPAAKKAETMKITETPVVSKTVEASEFSEAPPSPAPKSVEKEVDKQGVDKPAAGKKAAAKSAKSDAPKRTAAKKSTTSITRIIAKVDIGYGNILYLRGEGGGLSWETGIPMENTGGDQWSWSTKSTVKEVVFKFLVNDQMWSSGDNLSVAHGDTFITTPGF